MPTLKLVPFNEAWITNQKLDVKAIYRRPRFVKDEFDQDVLERDAEGVACYDLTTPLPVRSHNRWRAKGFEYVTLASRADLYEAAKKGTVVDDTGAPCNGRMYDQHQTGGPWNAKMYLAGQRLADSAALQKLRLDVERFGSDAVEVIRQQTDPTFTLPPHLRNIPAGGKVPDPVLRTTNQANAGSAAVPASSQPAGAAHMFDQASGPVPEPPGPVAAAGRSAKKPAPKRKAAEKVPA